MRLSRSSLRDLALASLGLVVLALVLAVLGGTGSPGTATPAPAAAATPSSTPSPPAVRALLLGDARAAELAPAVASATGWDVSAEASPATGLVTGPAGAELPARAAASAAAADVVVLVASASDGEQPDPASYGARVRALIAAVRIARPEVQVVVLGPVGTTPDAFRMQRDALTLASARFGTFFVDPVSGGWLDGRPELLAPDGTTPSAAGTAEIARRMVADLQVVLPPGLLPPA